MTVLSSPHNLPHFAFLLSGKEWGLSGEEC